MIMQFRHEPVALILTDKALPTLDRTTYAWGVQRGAYILAEAPNGTPEVLLLAPAARSRCASRRMNSSRPRASRPAWSACHRGRSSSTTVANIRSIASTCCQRR